MELVDLHGTAIPATASGKEAAQHSPTPHPFVQEALRVLGGEVIETKQGKIF
ncbi:MAG: hypothetical protein MPW15_24685 [Candidatus Manganitrophus sp.]|nr:hypothetical protein [Candidatus Manganitrophus sp.]